MADLYLKRLESERKTLWATCRLKGLAKDTPERQRIAEIDCLIAKHKTPPPPPPSRKRGRGRPDPAERACPDPAERPCPELSKGRVLSLSKGALLPPSRKREGPGAGLSP